MKLPIWTCVFVAIVRITTGWPSAGNFRATPSEFDQCIETDLSEIEELRMNLLSNTKWDWEEVTNYVPFGVNDEDWQRLSALERLIPEGSKLEKKLVAAFRLLIAAIHQAQNALKEAKGDNENWKSESSKYDEASTDQTLIPENEFSVDDPFKTSAKLLNPDDEIDSPYEQDNDDVQVIENNQPISQERVENFSKISGGKQLEDVISYVITDTFVQSTPVFTKTYEANNKLFPKDDHMVESSSVRHINRVYLQENEVKANGSVKTDIKGLQSEPSYISEQFTILEFETPFPSSEHPSPARVNDNEEENTMNNFSANPAETKYIANEQTQEHPVQTLISDETFDRPSNDTKLDILALADSQKVSTILKNNTRGQTLRNLQSLSTTIQSAPDNKDKVVNFNSLNYEHSSTSERSSTESPFSKTSRATNENSFDLNTQTSEMFKDSNNFNIEDYLETKNDQTYTPTTKTSFDFPHDHNGYSEFVRKETYAPTTETSQNFTRYDDEYSELNKKEALAPTTPNSKHFTHNFCSYSNSGNNETCTPITETSQIITDDDDDDVNDNFNYSGSKKIGVPSTTTKMSRSLTNSYDDYSKPVQKETRAPFTEAIPIFTHDNDVDEFSRSNKKETYEPTSRISRNDSYLEFDPNQILITPTPLIFKYGPNRDGDGTSSFPVPTKEQNYESTTQFTQTFTQDYDGYSEPDKRETHAPTTHVSHGFIPEKDNEDDESLELNEGGALASTVQSNLIFQHDDGSYPESEVKETHLPTTQIPPIYKLDYYDDYSKPSQKETHAITTETSSIFTNVYGNSENYDYSESNKNETHALTTQASNVFKSTSNPATSSKDSFRTFTIVFPKQFSNTPPRPLTSILHIVTPSKMYVESLLTNNMMKKCSNNQECVRVPYKEYNGSKSEEHEVDLNKYHNDGNDASLDGNRNINYVLWNPRLANWWKRKRASYKKFG